MRRVITAILLICIAVSSYYLGVREGGRTMATIASQNAVSDAIGRLDESLRAIKMHDLSYSMKQHQRDFGSALFELGSYAPAVPYWKCTDRDRVIVEGAKNYLAMHPGIDDVPPKPLLERALEFCR